MNIWTWLLGRRKPPTGDVAALPHVVIPAHEPEPTPVALSSADAKAMQARGYRNRNPGNIDWSAQNGWLGQIGRETLADGKPGRFAVFDTHEHGIRALSRLLITYGERHGLRTVAGIINRWAPPNENITSSYVAFVARLVGVKADDPVDVTQYAIARPMVEAIIRKELGGCPYPASVIDAGLKLAGIEPQKPKE